VNDLVLPCNRYGDTDNSTLRLIIKFVIIDYWWWIRLLLLLLLEPAEAKEEHVWSYSVVHTNSIGLADVVRYYKLYHGKRTYVAYP
jgi:hypothetical protein